ncbi:hypothetical protein [Sulfuracidifex tepidarius]|uniref:Uncharacterized protein n=1 Tax=Sulfuracidifex tepidarius TaxID=1294262 RepID=A0A510E6W8_9CREN|nr:hypothetical protein [Sulfuracidifex tepidarius]BBG25475.1 hypothetical protein IC006_2811 [Sulfuracidifex tepidarius]BBG28269.1 hypothetical protein IC007_2825 [Sulfuracidifex tepidarius]
MPENKAEDVIKKLDLSAYPCSIERLYTAISLFLSGKITEEGFMRFLGRKTEFEVNLLKYLKEIRN